MKTGNLLLILISLVLSGCSSSPTSLTYYVLHTPTSHTKSAGDINRQLHLQQLTFPEYLKQRSLAMQTSSTTVFFSPRHVWAEPMDKSFRQALSEAMVEKGHTELVPGYRSPSQRSLTHLHVNIDDFIASYDGNVIIKGQYWFERDGEMLQRKYFDFRRPMKGDGFEQAVITMRLLVIDLAGAISQQMPQSVP